MGLKEFRTLRIKKEENKELGKERLKGCRRDREEKGGTNLNRGKDRKHMKENGRKGVGEGKIQRRGRNQSGRC